MYKSQFKSIDSYDWFCGSGSYMTDKHALYFIYVKTVWSRLMDNVYEIQVHES